MNIFKSNKTLAFAALQQNRCSFNDLYGNLKNDKDFVLEALRYNADIFQYWGVSFSRQ